MTNARNFIIYKIIFETNIKKCNLSALFLQCQSCFKPNPKLPSHGNETIKNHQTGYKSGICLAR